MSSVAEALRVARQRRQLTQEQVGRLLDPPLNHSVVSRYEAGLRVPPATLVQLARVLHLDLALTTHDDPQSTQAVQP
jgi:transcriptional regulator with XRE-family HTH domain